MEDSAEFASRAAEWAGFTLSDASASLLGSYAAWLETEAIPAGGLGPREASRLWTRHIGDSLTFAAGWTTPPVEVLDVGSGVGLPGLPLAALWPGCHVTLLDRGGRRVRLLRRAVRLLGLEHVQVAQGDAFAVAEEWGGLVFRGSIKPMEAVGLSSKLLADNGIAVLGLSRRAEEPADLPALLDMSAALGLTAEATRVPLEVLDAPAWLLIMKRT